MKIKSITEYKSAQQAAIAVNMKKAGKKPKSVNEGQYGGQYATKDEAIAYAKEKVKSFRDPEDGIEIWAMPSGRFDVVHNMNSHGRNDVIRNGGKKLGTIGKRYKGVAEEQLDELSVHKMLKYSDAAEKDRDVLNQKWDNRTASEKEKERVLRHEKGEQRAADKIKQKTGKLPVQIGKLDRLKHAITREGVAEGWEADVNKLGYKIKSSPDGQRAYRHDSDKVSHVGTNNKNISWLYHPDESGQSIKKDYKKDVAEDSLNEHGDPWEDPDYDPRGSGKEKRTPEQIAKDRAEYAELSKKLGLSNKSDKASIISDQTKVLNHYIQNQQKKKKDVKEQNWSHDPWRDKHFGPTAGALKKIFKVIIQDSESNRKAFNVKAETEKQAREVIEKHVPGCTVKSIKFVKNLMSEQKLDEISSKLAGDYYIAATKKHIDKVGMRPGMYDRIEKDMGAKRKQGMDRALDRIIKDVDQDVKEGTASLGAQTSNHSKIMDLIKTYYKSMGLKFWDWFNEPGNKEFFAKRIDVTPEEAYQVVDSMDWGQHDHDEYDADQDMSEGKTGPGLWANIHAKQNRIKSGSGERMRKPGSKGAPKASDFKKAAAKNESSNYGDLDEAFNLEEEIKKLDEKSAAWQRKEGKSKSGGLNKKGVASYRRANPGSKLQTAVTTKPSKLKPGSKPAKRRKSFCARMSGVKGPMKKPNGKPTRKALALRKWNC